MSSGNWRERHAQRIGTADDVVGRQNAPVIQRRLKWFPDDTDSVCGPGDLRLRHHATIAAPRPRIPPPASEYPRDQSLQNASERGRVNEIERSALGRSALLRRARCARTQWRAGTPRQRHETGSTPKGARQGDKQILDSLDRLSPRGRRAIIALAKQRGLDWTRLSDEERERLVDDILHA